MTFTFSTNFPLWFVILIVSNRIHGHSKEQKNQEQVYKYNREEMTPLNTEWTVLLK